MKKIGLLQKFKEKHGHENAPTENVRKVKSVKNMSGYMMKYLSKNPEDEEDHEKRQNLCENPIKGRLWGCSRSLSYKNKCKEYITPEMTEELRSLMSRFGKVIVDEGYLKVIAIKRGCLKSKKFQFLGKLWMKFLKDICDKDPPQKGPIEFD